MNKKQIVKYLLFVFILAYAIEIPVSFIALKNQNNIGTSVFQIAMMVVMFTPFFGALFAKGNFKGISFIPKFKKVWFLIPLCFFGPAIFATLGAALFYIIYPDMFDLTGSYMQSTLPEGTNIIDVLEAAGLSYKIYIVIVILQSITYAPLLNMFVALGEEVGWRGFLYPELNKSMGKVPTWLLGGLIWGAFHYPIIIIAGYEYGFDYFGYPVVGLIVFTVFTITLGLIHEIVYDKTKCIWYPALLHGAVNASSFGALFYSVLNPERAGKLTIMGPFFNGIVAGLPLFILAIVLGAVVLIKKSKKAETLNDNQD
ncbi:MAG: CPBP family intramembrane metalloprotease [Lachnospiraceae bacterium]|nr:CPBP family intramembrane metalloprotease [Lachnospiraceae bacterium]